MLNSPAKARAYVNALPTADFQAALLLPRPISPNRPVRHTPAKDIVQGRQGCSGTSTAPRRALAAEREQAGISSSTAWGDRRDGRRSACALARCLNSADGISSSSVETIRRAERQPPGPQTPSASSFRAFPLPRSGRTSLLGEIRSTVDDSAAARRPRRKSCEGSTCLHQALHERPGEA